MVGDRRGGEVMTKWVLAVTVPMAICLVYILGHVAVTTIYYAGKSAGWVDGFDRGRATVMCHGNGYPSGWEWSDEGEIPTSLLLP